MVPFLASLLTSLASAALSYAMLETPPDAQNTIADKPTTEDGMVIPVIFGTCTVKKLNCLWYGDCSVHDIIANGGK